MNDVEADNDRFADRSRWLRPTHRSRLDRTTMSRTNRGRSSAAGKIYTEQKIGRRACGIGRGRIHSILP